MMTTKKIGEFISAIVTPLLGDDMEFVEEQVTGGRYNYHRSVDRNSPAWTVRSKVNKSDLALTARSNGVLRAPQWATTKDSQGYPRAIEDINLESPTAMADLVTTFLPQWKAGIENHRKSVQKDGARLACFRGVAHNLGAEGDVDRYFDVSGPAGRASLRVESAHTISFKIEMSNIPADDAVAIVSMLSPFIKAQSTAMAS